MIGVVAATMHFLFAKSTADKRPTSKKEISIELNIPPPHPNSPIRSALLFSSYSPETAISKLTKHDHLTKSVNHDLWFIYFHDC